MIQQCGFLPLRRGSVRTELSEIMRDTLGYPLGISIIARRLSGGVEYGKKIFDEGVEKYLYILRKQYIKTL